MKLFTKKETSNPDIFRVVDLNGNWTRYWIKSKNIYVPGVTTVLKTSYPKGYGFYNYLLGTTKEEAEKILEKAGDEGSRIHDAIGDLIQGHEVSIDSLYPSETTGKPEKLNMREYECLLAWEAFVKKFQPETIFVEHTVANERTAGTIDYVCSLQLTEGDKVSYNNKVQTVKKTTRIFVVLDWKSSGGIWPEYKAQTGIYQELLGDPKVEYTGIVRVGTKHQNGGYELKLWDKDFSKKHAKLFYNALENHEYENSDPYEMDETEIPDSIKVEIPKYQAPALKKVAKKATPKRAVKAVQASVTK